MNISPSYTVHHSNKFYMMRFLVSFDNQEQLDEMEGYIKNNLSNYKIKHMDKLLIRIYFYDNNDGLAFKLRYH